MKKIIFILTINFLICNCSAGYSIFSPLYAILSTIGRYWYNDATQNEEIQLGTNFHESTLESNLDDPELEREHDPLSLIIVSLNRKTLVGSVANPMLFGQYIRTGEFVDILFACPMSDKEKQMRIKAAASIAKDAVTKTPTHVIEKNYLSVVTKFIEQAKQLYEETSKKDAIDTPDREIGNTSTSEKIKHRGNTLGDTATELNSNHQKDSNANTSNFIQGEEPGHEDSVDEQAEKQKNRDSGHDEMKSDSTSIQKTDGTDPNKTETPAPESETQESVTSKPKIKTASDSLTSTTEKFWVKALDDVKNFKCQKPVTVHFMEYTQIYDPYKAYLAGFVVSTKNYETLRLPEFEKLPNEEDVLFWSFSIIFTESDRKVVCVFQEIQYNKDTYSPEINDNFDEHDLGKDMLFPDMDISQLYSIENQKEVFSILLRDHLFPKNFFDPDQEKFLVKVHLAPLHGFVNPLARQSGKTYGNVAPMWNSVRNGAWRKVEDYINTLSHVLIDLIVVTGTYGILNVNGRDVYLGNDKVPVPQLFWKLVIYGSEAENSRGMFIVTSNDPFKYVDDLICKEDTSQLFGWEYIQEKSLAKGHTISCPLEREMFQYVSILRSAEPAEILDLNDLSSLVEKRWEFNELGIRTTEEQRETILDKLKPHKTLVDDKIIATGEKIEENLENKDEIKTNEKIIAIDEKNKKKAL